MNEIIKLTDEMVQRLDRVASLTGSSRDSLLHRLVEDGLEDAEADLRADAIEARIDDGREGVQDGASVRRLLGLDD